MLESLAMSGLKSKDVDNRARIGSSWTISLLCAESIQRHERDFSQF